MIFQAASLGHAGRAIVLGAGLCEEIPLADLAGRFDTVTLVDHDPALVERAIVAAQLPEPTSTRLVSRVADLTGTTARFLGNVATCLDSSPTTGAADAADTIARLADAEQPDPFTTGERYDLVVASCVLCQLHLGACNGAIAAFDARFPGQVDRFRQSQRWVQAMYGLARRMEEAFIDSLGRLVSPGGRIYLSDTIQFAFLHTAPDGRWITEGMYRMTRTLQLSDYLDDRFHVEQQGRWPWVQPPAPVPGAIGKLYNVQALILSPNTRKDSNPSSSAKTGF